MTPAERKFSNVEGGLTRGQSLVRVLREVCACGLKDVDLVLWNGIYALVCEAETSLDAASEVWTEAHKLASDRP